MPERKKRPYSKSQADASRRWNDANYTRIAVSLPKADGQSFRDKCLKKNIPQASILKDAIYNFLGED